MSDNPVIARMKCPICGEDAQDVKINKNGNLYIYCDNGCRVNFSGKESRKIKPVLLAGNNTSSNGIYITSLKGQKQNETKLESRRIETGSTNVLSGQTGRVEFIRRTDAGPAGVQQSGNAAAAAAKPRGILAGFFDDDD